MALAALGWKLVANIRDRGKGKTSRTFWFVQSDVAGDMSGLETTAAAWVTAFNNVSDAKIASYSISKVFADNAYTPPTLATSEVEGHAEISAAINNIPNKFATIDIPGPKDAIFVATSGSNADVVNVANAAVLAYVGMFNSINTQFYLSDGEVVDGDTPNLTGKRTHSGSRKS